MPDKPLKMQVHSICCSFNNRKKLSTYVYWYSGNQIGCPYNKYSHDINSQWNYWNAEMPLSLVIYSCKHLCLDKRSKNPGKTVLQKVKILLVFFLQDLQDLALNLASLALKWSFSCKIWKILQESCKKLQDNVLARFCILARKVSFLVQDFQDMCKI